MNRRNSICLLIVKTLRKKKAPISAYEIAQIAKQRTSLVFYHLKKLEKDQIIKKTEDGYVLTPILYDNQLLDAIYAVLTPFVSDTAAECESPEQVLSVLQISLELFLNDLKPRKIISK